MFFGLQADRDGFDGTVKGDFCFELKEIEMK